MAPGIVLIIVGATFTFALRAEPDWLNTHALGLILMLGGAGFIWRSRARQREVVTRRTDGPGGSTEDRTIVEHELD
jgi:predicted membrane channel-forming protein YqfA (hemolysin III family)